MPKFWTIQCGYPAYYANTVCVEAETLEEACKKAIEEANQDPNWKSVSYCGDTFIDAINEGEWSEPWQNGRSATEIPADFQENAKILALEARVKELSDVEAWRNHWRERAQKAEAALAGLSANPATKKREPIVAENGEVFTVEEVEPGVFQSVFPTALAHASQLHESEYDAWAYIETVIGTCA